MLEVSTVQLPLSSIHTLIEATCPRDISLPVPALAVQVPSLTFEAYVSSYWFEKPESAWDRPMAIYEVNDISHP